MGKFVMHEPYPGSKTASKQKNTNTTANRCPWPWMTVSSLHWVQRNRPKLGQLPVEISNIYTCLMSSLFNSTRKKTSLHVANSTKTTEMFKDLAWLAIWQWGQHVHLLALSTTTLGSKLGMGSTWMVIYGQSLIGGFVVSSHPSKKKIYIILG